MNRNELTDMNCDEMLHFITPSEALELNLYLTEMREPEMDITQAFPSDFLKAADLQGREVTVTMAGVQMEKLGDEEKPVLFFEGKDRGLVLNKTNANTIIDMFGPETKDWAGKRVIIFPTQTDFQGRQVACIRVKVMTPPKQADMDMPADLPF
jgi:hypothetical protein